MMPLYQLERQLRAFGAELHQLKPLITRPNGATCRFFYFMRDDKIAPTSCTHRNDDVSAAECERIRRVLDIPT